jgi:branched-chain amino acid transport system ATP-binding protein
MSAALIQASGLTAFYGDAQALFGIDFTLNHGELVAVIGANGAGKSTFLKSLIGLVKVKPESVQFNGQPVGGLPPGVIVKQGLAMVPEGRRLFPSLSVEENLLMGACAKRPGPWNLERLYAMFPILKQKLCDELSLGLAPIVIKEIYDAMPAITAEGMSVVIVEQDVSVAQRVSQRVYCFQEGRVSLEGKSDELTREQISQAYFGL